MRAKIVTLLDSDVTYLIPPEMDSTQWYADQLETIMREAAEALVAERALKARIDENNYHFGRPLMIAEIHGEVVSGVPIGRVSKRQAELQQQLKDMEKKV
jgi:hypothetical protein